MTLPGVSIVMTPRDRTRLLMVTLESITRQNYPDLEIIIVEDRPSDFTLGAYCARNKMKYAARKSPLEGWMNPAPLLNRGLQMATKEIVIFQNAECRHDSENCIEKLVTPIAESVDWLSTSACVQSLDKQGAFEQWYVHPNQGARAGWISPFCQAVPRAAAMKIQGFEEGFKGYGYEDDLFEFMLKSVGVRFSTILGTLVTHMWHPRYNGDQNNGNREYFKSFCAGIEVGAIQPAANLNKSWGNI
jgi:glycosyltransferase involved in cell wall biosynthesis